MLKIYQSLTPEYQILKRARARASSKGLDYDLEVEDISIPEFCPILGIKLFVGKGTLHSGSPTLDRIDNSLGYIKGNVSVISHKANSHKANLTLEQAKRLVSYMEKELH